MKWLNEAKRSPEEKADLAIEWCKRLERRNEVLQEQIDHLMAVIRAKEDRDEVQS